MPIFACPCSAAELNANPVMERETVKPIPADALPPTTWLILTPDGRRPPRAPRAALVTPAIPNSFPRTSPPATAQVRRLPAAARSSVAPRATRAIVG